MNTWSRFSSLSKTARSLVEAQFEVSMRPQSPLLRCYLKKL